MKTEVINLVKHDLELLIEDCEYIVNLAKQGLEVFDNFESERTLSRLENMQYEIRRLNDIVLNLVTTVKMSCLVVLKEKANKNN